MYKTAIKHNLFGIDIRGHSFIQFIVRTVLILQGVLL